MVRVEWWSGRGEEGGAKNWDILGMFAVKLKGEKSERQEEIGDGVEGLEREIESGSNSANLEEDEKTAKKRKRRKKRTRQSAGTGSRGWLTGRKVTAIQSPRRVKKGVLVGW
jgi:hypothetical protein